MKKLLLISILLFLADYAHADNLIQIKPVERRDVISEDTLRESAEYGDYEVRIYRDWEIGVDGVVQIFQKGKLVFEEQNYRYYLGRILDDFPENGQDITGDGEPNLVISHWSGGAHCCYDFYVFSIGEEFKFLDKIDAGHGDLGGFEDVDGDGTLEFKGADWIFAYWNASFAGSPAPEVILRYENGSYRLAYDLMKKPLEQLKKESEKWLKETSVFQKANQEGYSTCWNNDCCIDSGVWGYMLEFIYGGHPEEAWKFLDEIWQCDEETRQVFITDFKSRLVESYYAYGLPVDLEDYKTDVGEPLKK